MSVNPVSGSAAAQQNEQVTSQQNQNVPKQQSGVPEDTVNISSAAKAMQTSPSGDVDHDGDSK